MHTSFTTTIGFYADEMVQLDHVVWSESVLGLRSICSCLPLQSQYLNSSKWWSKEHLGNISWSHTFFICCRYKTIHLKIQPANIDLRMHAGDDKNLHQLIELVAYPTCWRGLYVPISSITPFVVVLLIDCWNSGGKQAVRSIVGLPLPHAIGRPRWVNRWF